MSTSSSRSGSVVVRCPTCGEQARAEISWSGNADAQHADVGTYTCPSGCQVDAESVRRLLGAQ